MVQFFLYKYLGIFRILCINLGVCNYFPGPTRIFRQTPHRHVGLVAGGAHSRPFSHSPHSSLQPCPQASPSFFGRSFFSTHTPSIPISGRKWLALHSPEQQPNPLIHVSLISLHLGSSLIEG